MKKISKIVLVLLVLVLFTGCSSNKGDGGASGDIQTVVMYLPGDPASNHDQIVEAANKIIREKIGAELDLKFVNWGEYSTKVNLWLSTGEEGIDIVTTGGLGVEAFTLNAERGSLTDITDLANEYAKEALDLMHPAYKEATTVNGRLYGIAANANVYGQGVVAINSTYLDKYNLSLEGVNSIGDLKPLLEVIKENEPTVTPYWVDDTRVLGGLEFMFSDRLPFAIDIYGDQTKVINPYEHAEYLSQLKQVRSLYAAGLTNTDPVAVEFPWETDLWFAKMTESGPSDYENYILETVAGKPVELVTIQKPIIDKTHALMSTMVVPKNSKKPDKAVQLMNLLYTDKELMTILGYGIEGENWERLEGDKLRKTENFDGTKLYSPWNYGNKMNMLMDEAISDEQIASVNKKMETADISPVLGFVVDTESFKSELANIQSIMEKYSVSIHAGVVETDPAIEKMMAELHEAGYEKVLEEVQRQYDEYRK